MYTRIVALVASFALSVVAHAKVWRVNNNGGISANFTDINNAVGSLSVASGDTLYLEPSAADYGIYTGLTKSVTIIGNGFNLSGANGNPGLQYNTNNSTVYIQPGIDLNGIKLIGLYVTTNAGWPFGTQQNLSFEKCCFRDGFYLNTNANNVSVRKCFIGGTINVTGGTMSNIVFENNIVQNGGNPQSTIAVYFTPNNGSTNIIFRNNTIWRCSDANFKNVYMANNIIYSSPGAYGVTLQNPIVVRNNIFTDPVGIPASVGNVDNQINVPVASLFQSSSASMDGRYQLAPGSPAIAAGRTVGSVVSPDCGAFGGPDPYKLSGIPGIPSIYNLVVPAGTIQGLPLNVTISTRSNN